MISGSPTCNSTLVGFVYVNFIVSPHADAVTRGIRDGREGGLLFPDEIERVLPEEAYSGSSFPCGICCETAGPRRSPGVLRHPGTVALLGAINATMLSRYDGQNNPGYDYKN